MLTRHRVLTRRIEPEKIKPYLPCIFFDRRAIGPTMAAEDEFSQVLAAILMIPHDQLK